MGRQSPLTPRSELGTIRTPKTALTVEHPQITSTGDRRAGDEERLESMGVLTMEEEVRRLNPPECQAI